MISVEFQDMEDTMNSLNRKRFVSRDLLKALDGLRARQPFFCQLIANNGNRLDIGVGAMGCVQFSSSDGKPPYYMGVAPSEKRASRNLEFLAGGTPTPVDKRHCFEWDLVKKVVEDFLASGDRPSRIEWEEI